MQDSTHKTAIIVAVSLAGVVILSILTSLFLDRTPKESPVSTPTQSVLAPPEPKKGMPVIYPMASPQPLSTQSVAAPAAKSLVIISVPSFPEEKPSTAPAAPASVPSISKSASALPEETPALKAAPVANSSPTDQEIEESIKAQNERRQTLEDRLAERAKEAAIVRESALTEAALAKNKPPSNETQADPGSDRPSQEVIDDVRAHGYIVH